jgi:sulfate adenylyltransferase subunit 2
MESSAAAFLSEIEAFLARERVGPSAFGRAAVGDPNFVRELRGGRAPSLRLVDRTRAYMAGRRRAVRAASDSLEAG